MDNLPFWKGCGTLMITLFGFSDIPTTLCAKTDMCRRVCKR